MTYLVDTNVISELRKRRPDARVTAWWGTVRSEEIFVSVVTLGEIRLGAGRLRRKDPAQAERLAEWLRGLTRAYRDHIVEVDLETALAWGEMAALRPLPVIDGLLAASAKVRNWTLVTRNTADLAGTGVALLNPFEPLA